MGDLSRLPGYEEMLRAEERRARKAGKRRGLHVRCVDCFHEATGIRTSCLRRLRALGCSECGGRLRALHWSGWEHLESWAAYRLQEHRDRAR